MQSSVLTELIQLLDHLASQAVTLINRRASMISTRAVTKAIGTPTWEEPTSNIVDYKYPKTSHFDFSQSVMVDDNVISSLGDMYDQEVVVTEKLDGENSTLLRTNYHARSLDSRHHPSRDWLKKFHGEIAYKIPEKYRICGENVFAKHSIYYQDLSTYFYGFSVWDERNVALSWDDTLLWFDLLEITPVPVFFRGHFNKMMMAKLLALTKNLDIQKHEGFVVRIAGEIPYDKFGKLAAKWVRKNHVQTDEHWMFQEVVPNCLKE